VNTSAEDGREVIFTSLRVLCLRLLLARALNSSPATRPQVGRDDPSTSALFRINGSEDRAAAWKGYVINTGAIGRGSRITSDDREGAQRRANLSERTERPKQPAAL